MNPVDATCDAPPASESRSERDVVESRAWHRGLASSPDLLVERTRPIVADLIAPGRLGLGTLLAPTDPLVIADGVCYRLDVNASVGLVSSAELVRHATVVDFRDARRFRIETPVPGADIVRLVAEHCGPLPHVVAVELVGTFSEVVVRNGFFGRTAGSAVGFVTHIASAADWHMSFLTHDRTFGGLILEASIDTADLSVLAPRVVYQAQRGESLFSRSSDRSERG